MARYLLVAVDKNERATAIQERLDSLAGVMVVGKFAAPTKFCECPVKGELTPLDHKIGWWRCDVCGRPREGSVQHPRNLLLDRDLPQQFVDLRLTVREPYMSPYDRYGVEAIEAKVESLEATRLLLEEWRRKRDRRTARKKKRKRDRPRRGDGTVAGH